MNSPRFYFFFSFGLLLSLPFFLFGMNNPDLFWHLSAGKYIFENLSIPNKDFLSWTLNGSPWLDFEWLTQVIYYGLYSLAGLEALYFLKIAIISASLFVFSLIVKEKGVNERHLFWLLPLLCASTLTSSDVRPENFSVLLFLILWHKTQNIEKLKLNAKTFLFCFLFFSLWTNLHGGFIYGLLLLFLKFSGLLLNENLAFAAGKAPFEFKASKKAIFCLAAAFAGSLLNPYGFNIYAVMSAHLAHSQDYAQLLLEWRDFDITLPYFRPFSFLLISFPILYLWTFLKTRKIDFFELFSAIFFIFAALFHLRNLVFAAYVILIISAEFLKNFQRIRHFAALSILFVFSLTLHFFSVPAKDYAQFKIADFYFSSPKLISFLKENEKELAGLKIYNSWAWGGYLGFNLFPSYKVFIDGRYIFSPMLGEFAAARDSLQLWRELLKKYDFSLIVAPPSGQRMTVRKKLKDSSVYAVNIPLYLLQLPKEDWAIVYFDKKNFVAVRRKAVSASWLKKREYKLLAPQALDNLEYPIYYGDLPLKEVEKEVFRYALENHAGDENSYALELLNWYKGLQVKGKKNDKKPSSLSLCRF